jgi:hypothetical protein
MARRLLRSLVIAGSIVAGLALAAAADQRTYQTANIFQAGNPAIQLGGAATLFRSKQGAEMRIATSGLAENSAYTVWWVVFNNPAACTGGCGADDLGNPAVRAAVFYAAGFVTAGDGIGTEDGTGNVSAHMEAGALPLGIDVEVEGGLEPGNGFRAEIHLVVRTHGTINPGMVDQQIGSFNGGCNPTCANQQAAVFLPVE